MNPKKGDVGGREGGRTFKAQRQGGGQEGGHGESRGQEVMSRIPRSRRDTRHSLEKMKGLL